MRKLSMRQIRKLSKRDNEAQLIHEMKERVIKDPIIIAKFKEYGVPLEEIWDVPVSFCDLDVSAKTKNMEIFLNRKMLDDNSKVKDPTNYLVHEITHFLQQKTGLIKEDQNNKDYLDKETEVEAFQAQIDFKKREEGEDEVNRYVTDLLDHHDLHGKERKNKKEELLEDE